MIYGIGTDLVEINRIANIIKRWGERFTGKVFSQNEINYCQNKAYPAIHYAARFAAKESFLKSLGIGLGMGVSLKDIEVINNPQGSPQLHMNEKIQGVLDERGITAIHISMTHTREHAQAVVVLEK
jgi:holo-[acyl-carrier protein] synthase